MANPQAKDVTWKKRKDIGGVSASTIVELKSTLETAKADAKRLKLTGRLYWRLQWFWMLLGCDCNEIVLEIQCPSFRSRSTASKGWTLNLQYNPNWSNLVPTKKTQALYSAQKQNKGVQDRAHRDEESFTQEEKNWDVAEARLKAKSQLYDKMIRGEVTPSSYDDEDNAAYLVDFERKNWRDDDNDTDRNPSMYSYDMDQEDERKRWEDESFKEMEEADQRRERIRMAEQLNQDTKRGRSKHIEMKVKRKQEMAARLRIIKDKEIKRKLGQTEDTTQEEQDVGPKPATGQEMYDPEAVDEEEEAPPLATAVDQEVVHQQQIERSINELFRSVKQDMYHDK